MKIGLIIGYLIVIIILLVTGAIAGFMVYDKYNEEYKDLTVETCQYANTLTDIVNMQSTAMEQCRNMSEGELQRLNHLNCTLIE